MTLSELELTSPSQLLGGGRPTTNPPPVAMDRSLYSGHNVVFTKATLRHGGRKVQLELWTVVGAQALVLTGPKKWLPDGTPWFCRDDQDLCDLLIYQMEEVWGSDNYDTGDPGASLNTMCSGICRISTMPSVTGLSPTTAPCPIELIGGLDLV